MENYYEISCSEEQFPHTKIRGTSKNQTCKFLISEVSDIVNDTGKKFDCITSFQVFNISMYLITTNSPQKN